MKFVFPYGLHLLNAAGNLTSPTGLTLALYTPGQSFLPVDEWSDVYTVNISNGDTVSRVVQLTDGTTTVTYNLAGGAVINDDSHVPWRFNKGKPLTASCTSAGTSGSQISIGIRGVTSKT